MNREFAYMDKLSKIWSLIKKYGLYGTFKKLLSYLYVNYLERSRMLSESEKQAIKKAFSRDDVQKIILWKGNFGWNVPLFQRPQHMMRAFAGSGCLVLYEVTRFTDHVSSIEKVEDNLFLVNANHAELQSYLEKLIGKSGKPVYLDVYSTDWNMSLRELEGYIAKNYKIIYEYIDEISPLLSGTKDIPQNVREKYNYVMAHPEITAVVTADTLLNDVYRKRGRENVIFAPNGVDYDHFAHIDMEKEPDGEYQKIIESKRPIIGYYGALASWFDYDLIKYLAKQRPDLAIVLIGIAYDETLKKELANDVMKEYPNIYFLGAKKYEELPIYANKMDILTIPFLINDITRSTSPLKLYEYMALRKPIVTTAMPECEKYESVLIARNKEHFLEQIENALELRNCAKYLEILDHEALMNTWNARAGKILESIG